MKDEFERDREILAGSTPDAGDLMAAWAGIYRAAIDGDDTKLAEAIGHHARVVGIKSESGMRANKQRVMDALQKIKYQVGLSAALARVESVAHGAGRRA